MKKAVIATGGKQYLVSEGDTLDVELLESAKGKLEFVPLLVIEDKKITVGSPDVPKARVSATIETDEKKLDKVIAIRYKSKKRVHKLRGHRQKVASIKIAAISL